MPREEGTVDISKLKENLCEIIKVGKNKVAVCREKDRLTLYTLEEE